MKNIAEETTANSATAQLAQEGEWPVPASVAGAPITAFPSVSASVVFHDALRVCVDALSYADTLRLDHPNRAIYDHQADEATAYLTDVIDRLFARRLALAKGLAWTDDGTGEEDDE